MLNLREAAGYLGCSFWTVRDWVLAGHLPTINLPPLRAREGDRQKKTLRRVLVDRYDLDAFIEARKSGGHLPTDWQDESREIGDEGAEFVQSPASRKDRVNAG